MTIDLKKVSKITYEVNSVLLDIAKERSNSKEEYKMPGDVHDKLKEIVTQLYFAVTGVEPVQYIRHKKKKKKR